MATALQMMNKLLAELDGGTKSASSVAGTDGPQAEKDPGTFRGESRHPSAKVDSQTTPARQGARSAENEADLKHDQPAGVDQMTAGGGGGQDSRQLNIGMRQSATGEDASVERRFKSRPEDPGTSSPADADDIGAKYASMSPTALCQLGVSSLNQLLAAVVAEPKQAGWQPDEQEAAQAGRQLADLMVGQTGKQASSNEYATAVVEEVIAEALTKAAAVAEFLQDYREELGSIKRAGGEMPVDPAMMQAMAGGEGMPGDMPPMPGGEPPMPEDASMGDMPPDEGDPMAGDPMAGDPTEGGPMAGDPMEGGQEEAVEQLVNSLIEAGISPDELMAAVSEEAAQGGAGGEGEGEGVPKMASADRSQWRHMAKAAKARQRAPEFRFKAARPGPEREHRDAIVSYLREVCGR